MTNKPHALWIVHLWLCCASTACVAEGGVVVTIQDSVISDFEAPGLVTGAFLISNLDSAIHDLIEDVQVPGGWQLVSEVAPFSLDAHAQDVRLVAVVVRANTPPGEYRVIYRIHESSKPEMSSQQELIVRVKALMAVELSVMDAPQFAEAGAAYAVTFSVKHTGNVNAAVDLSIRSSAGFDVVLDSTRINLIPDETRLVTARVSSTRRLLRPVKDRLVFRATASSDSLTIGTQTYSVVNVVPVSPSGEKRFRELPSRFTARYVGGEGKDGMQFELAGAGRLDPDDRYHVEYRLRGPERFENSVFGLRDEVYLKLITKNTSVAAGDQTFAVSNLLERGRLGRGGTVDVEQGKFEARAIGFQARAQIPDYEAYGAYFGFKPSRRFSLRGNFLNKKTELADDQLFSISSAFEPVPQWKVNLEAAGGAKDSANADWPLAISSRIDGRISGTQLSLQKHLANREFHGQIQDLDQNIFDIFTPLPGGFGWSFAYRDFAENLEKLESLPTAPREQHFRSGINYRNPAILNASLDFETHTRVDELAAPEFDNRAVLAIGRLQKSYKMFGVSTTVSRGKRHDYLTDSSPELENYRLSLEVQPLKGQRCEAWWQSGHSGYAIDTKRSRIFGVNADYGSVRGLKLHASFQSVDRDERDDFESLQYDLGVQYELLENHLVVLKLRKQDFDELQFERETSYLISYQLPLGIPVGRKRDLGSLEGRIYDADSPEAGGIQGVLLRIGDRTALTDRKGRFAFHSLKPGVHYLQIENATFGLDRVPLQVMPIELSVAGGKSENVNLMIVKSASLSGNVAIFGYHDENTERGVLIEEMKDDSSKTEHRDLIQISKLSNCALQLTNGNETINTTTAADGSFEVSKLRPGAWTLTVSAASLPVYHRTEYETYVLNLVPGQNAECNIRILPRDRHLLIAATGTLRATDLPLHATRIPVTPNPVPPKSEQAQGILDPNVEHDKPARVEHGLWFVQVGAFRSLSNAERRAAQLREAGYATIFVPLESAAGTIYQVRVGGFVTAEAAHSAAADLNQRFTDDALVISAQRPALNHIDKLAHHLENAAASADSGHALNIPVSENGEWYVQLGAYRLQSNVDHLTEVLKKANIRFKIVSAITTSDTLKQVRVGGFSLMSDSRAVAALFDSLLESHTLVIRGKTK